MSALLLIISIVSLTPSFALEMSAVAKDAQKYNEDSLEKMGFFKKIGFL